ASPPPDNPGKLGGFELRFGNSAAEKEHDLANPANVPESYGSGVVIDDQGHVITAYHVIRDATKIYVRLPGGKGCYADIHAADARADLAVLQLIGLRPSKFLALGDGGKVKAGQIVLSIANPFAAGFRDGQPSASWGIVSSLRRKAASQPPQTEESRGVVGPRGQPEDERSRTKPLHQFHTLPQTDVRLNA